MQRALSDPFERALAPLDRARVRVLRALMPVSSRLAAAREPRVLVLGALVLALSLGLCLAAPLWVLALGPIILGVPHLLADVRYCVVRPGWHRERALWLVAGVPLVAMGLGAPLEYGMVGVAASAMAISAAAEDGRARVRRAAVVVVALVLAGFARVLGSTADLILAHAHNFIAVALWASWRRRGARLHWWVLAGFVGLSVALMAGIGDFAWSRPLRFALPLGLGADVHLRSLAPDLAAPWGPRLVLLYCFAQSVHYGMWLRLVPEEDRDRPTPRTFRATYRSLREEMTAPVLVAFGLAALALALWACADLSAARTGYLRFARFHGVLELGALALFLVRGRWR